MLIFYKSGGSRHLHPLLLRPTFRKVSQVRLGIMRQIVAEIPAIWFSTRASFGGRRWTLPTGYRLLPNFVGWAGGRQQRGGIWPNNMIDGVEVCSIPNANIHLASWFSF